jgi:hypothetical protein
MLGLENTSKLAPGPCLQVSAKLEVIFAIIAIPYVWQVLSSHMRGEQHGETLESEVS